MPSGDQARLVLERPAAGVMLIQAGWKNSSAVREITAVEVSTAVGDAAAAVRHSQAREDRLRRQRQSFGVELLPRGDWSAAVRDSADHHPRLPSFEVSTRVVGKLDLESLAALLLAMELPALSLFSAVPSLVEAVSASTQLQERQSQGAMEQASQEQQPEEVQLPADSRPISWVASTTAHHHRFHPAAANAVELRAEREEFQPHPTDHRNRDSAAPFCRHEPRREVGQSADLPAW